MHRTNTDTLMNEQVNRDNMTVMRHPMTMQERAHLQCRALTSLTALHFEGSSRRPGPPSLHVSESLWRPQEGLECADPVTAGHLLCDLQWFCWGYLCIYAERSTVFGSWLGARTSQSVGGQPHLKCQQVWFSQAFCTILQLALSLLKISLEPTFGCGVNCSANIIQNHMDLIWFRSGHRIILHHYHHRTLRSVGVFTFKVTKTRSFGVASPKLQIIHGVTQNHPLLHC